MVNLFKFIKESFAEVIQKMSWPSIKQLENLISFFFIGLVVWVLFIFGVNRVFEFVQGFVYGWMYKEKTPD